MFFAAGIIAISYTDTSCFMYILLALLWLGSRQLQEMDARDSGTHCVSYQTFVFGFQVLPVAFLPTYSPFAKDTVLLLPLLNV
jgi:hypothetical protein